MRYLLSVVLMLVPTSSVDYRVFPIDSREVFVSCQNDTRPLVTTLENGIVKIKCVR